MSAGRRRVALVAIAGGSGSGKSWLARTLRRRLGTRAGIISLDDFYRDRSHVPEERRARINFDSPVAIDWARLRAVLREIAAGGEPELPRYDFVRHTRAARGRRWRRRDIVLVEGLWAWRDPQLRRLYAWRIYRETSVELRYARRLRRDQRQRGRSAEEVARQWRTQVEPMFARHVAGQRRWADEALAAELPAAEVGRLERFLRGLARGGQPRASGPAVQKSGLPKAARR